MAKNPRALLQHWHMMHTWQLLRQSKSLAPDGPAVRDALASLSMESVCGPLTFDENGDAVKKTAIVKTVKDGEFVYLDTVTVAE